MHKQNIFILLLMGILLISSCNNDDDGATPNNNNQNPNTTDLSSSTTAQDTEGNQYEVGFDQATSNNQNPFVVKKDASGTEIWRVTHESTPVDSRAVLVFVDANDTPWVVFTVDGGDNTDDYISKKEVEANAFSGVYSNSYGSGGGPKVSVIAQLNPENGKIVKGTFVTARLSNGNTNTLNITKLGTQNGNIAFEISSAAWPPGTGTSYVRFPDITDADRIDNAFKIYYEIKQDLSEIVVATLLTE